jgi:hypothetical protein
MKDPASAPVRPTPVTFSDSVPVLETVTVCPVDDEPASCVPNVRLVAETDATGVVPVPVRAMPGLLAFV